MYLLEKLMPILQYQAPIQTAYGRFHLIFIGLTLLFTLILCIFARNSRNSIHRAILWTVWVVIVLFELYKQFVFSVEVKNGEWVFDYAWYAFPFQFCSSPLYILPLAAMFQEQKIAEIFESFLSTFALFGGLIVMIMPGTVFETHMYGVAIQTMVHHSSMIVIGIYLLVRNRKRLSFKYFIKGVFPFLVLVTIAVVLNDALGNVTDKYVNLFFLTRRFDFSVPVLGEIHQKIPYAAYLAGYIVGFTAIAFVIYLIARILKAIGDKAAKRA